MFIVRRAKLYYTVSGIITSIGGRPVHILSLSDRWVSLTSQQLYPCRKKPRCPLNRRLGGSPGWGGWNFGVVSNTLLLAGFGPRLLGFSALSPVIVLSEVYLHTLGLLQN